MLITNYQSASRVCATALIATGATKDGVIITYDLRAGAVDGKST